jgi:F-type H+-transporting ATPase subunit delta
MAEIATIARPYADALLKAAPASERAGILNWLGTLAAVAGNSEMRRLTEDPLITADILFEVIRDVVKTDLPELANNFLRTLIDGNRVTILPEVFEQYRELVNHQNGLSDGVIYSAFAMGPAAIADVQIALERRFNRKLSLTIAVDESLIGGIRVVVGDEVLDTSVKTRLEQMKSALTA